MNSVAFMYSVAISGEYATAAQPLDYCHLYEDYRRRYETMRQRYQALRSYATEVVEDGEHYDDHTETMGDLRDYLQSTCVTCGDSLPELEQTEHTDDDEEQYSFSCFTCSTRDVRPLLENLNLDA